MTDFTQDAEQCLTVLQQGGIILYPTDTIWGLGCDAENGEAVEKLLHLKGKPDGRGLIVLLPSERDIFRYTASPDAEVFNFLADSDGPVTVIYENGLQVDDRVLNEDGSIAIRLVNEDFCRYLLKRLKRPIVSTSANFHGQASPQNFSQISTKIKAAVNYVVKFRQDDTSAYRASTIVKWESGKARVIRPGT